MATLMRGAPEVTIQVSLNVLAEKGWTKEGLAVIANALAGDKIIDTLPLRQVEV